MANVVWIGVLGLAAVAACWGLSVVLFRVGGPGTVARKLAWLLIFEGAALITAGFPFFILGHGQDHYGDNLPLMIGNFVVHHLADACMIALYPVFLAAALRTPMTQVFRGKRLRITIAVVAVLMAAGTVVSTAIWGSFFGSGLLYVTVMAVFVFALVASLHAWRVAPPGIARTRAKLFALAFGIRDICWGFTYGASFWMIWNNSFGEEFTLYWVVKIIYALGTLLAVPLIAYGILKAKMFDIDLKIRWTIKQSTLAAFIVSIIFLISEGASTILSEELGNIAGLCAAAVVIFFLTPLQRFADRIASTAMPNTSNTPQYVAYRKMQVYEEALIEAMEENGISAKERALLVRLRDSLGISPADAEAMENEISRRLEASDDHAYATQ
jgi:hypothetical protein